MKVWTLARLTVKENLARNMLASNAFYLVFLLGMVAFVQDTREEMNKYKLFVDGAFSLIIAFNLFFSFATTFPLIESDRVHYRLGLYLSSKLSRAKYILGKFLGGLLSSLCNLAIICACLSLISCLAFDEHPIYLLINYYVSFLELSMLVSIALFCSLAFSRFMGVLSFFLIYLLGHFTYYIKYYNQVVGAEQAKLIENLYLLLPNFEYFGIRNHLIGNQVVEPSYFLLITLFSLAWTGFFILLSQTLFERKSIQ